jgi:hypothetical protein
MSITRLQQARQMYAMGQRVGRIAFGGGGSYSSLGGYQGQGAAATGGPTGAPAGGAGTGIDGQGGTGGSSPEDNNPFNTGPDPVVTELDVKEQYALGNPVILDKPITSPDFTKVGPGSTQYNNYIDALNLQGATYKPPNIPFFIPGSGIIKTLGSFGFNKNKDFFEKNVAGKYGYGYGLKDFEKYMSDRTSGKVGAYGNEEQGQNAINARSDEGRGGGIIDVVVDDTTDNTTDDTTSDDELILRFLGEDSTLDPAAAGLASTDELRDMLLERAKNLYT